jgi:indole-3-acetate monooxygenase
MSGEDNGQKLLKTARGFRSRILAEREQIDAGRRLPEHLARDLARAGFFRIALPATYGGLDLPPTDELSVYEALARADASVAWCVWNGNTNWTTVRLPALTARGIFRDPEAIFANSTQPNGRAVVVEGGYRLSGRWSLVSFCQLSTGIMLASVVYENEAPRSTPSGGRETRFMFCTTADCEIVETWSSGGLRGTGSQDVVVRDLFVPASASSWHSDPLVLPDQRYKFSSYFRVVPGLGALALGIARGAIEALIELAAEKVPSRSSQTLREDGGAQTRLAQAEALVNSARLYLFDAVRRLWEDVLTTGEATVKRRTQILLANNHAETIAVQAVDLVYLTGGATSLYTSCLLERAFRDVHAITQHRAVNPDLHHVLGLHGVCSLVIRHCAPLLDRTGEL